MTRPPPRRAYSIHGTIARTDNLHQAGVPDAVVEIRTMGYALRVHRTGSWIQHIENVAKAAEANSSLFFLQLVEVVAFSVESVTTLPACLLSLAVVGCLIRPLGRSLLLAPRKRARTLSVQGGSDRRTTMSTRTFARWRTTPDTARLDTAGRRGAERGWREVEAERDAANARAEKPKGVSQPCETPFGRGVKV